MTDIKSARICIIGAGIAGLSAAHSLVVDYKCQNVVVLECSNEVGGRIVANTDLWGTVLLINQSDNQSIPLGAQFIHDSKSEIAKLAKKLKVMPSKKVVFHVFINSDV